MGDHAKAADLSRSPQRGSQRKEQQRSRMPLALVSPVDRELTQERDGYGVRPVPLLRLGEKLTLELRRAQRHIAGDATGLAIANDGRTRYSGNMVVPGVTAEPFVYRCA